jgi:hypothetical protein
VLANEASDKSKENRMCNHLAQNHMCCVPRNGFEVLELDFSTLKTVLKSILKVPFRRDCADFMIFLHASGRTLGLSPASRWLRPAWRPLFMACRGSRVKFAISGLSPPIQDAVCRPIDVVLPFASASVELGGRASERGEGRPHI